MAENLLSVFSLLKYTALFFCLFFFCFVFCFVFLFVSKHAPWETLSSRKMQISWSANKAAYSANGSLWAVSSGSTLFEKCVLVCRTGRVDYTNKSKKKEKDCIWKQRTHKITKISLKYIQLSLGNRIATFLGKKSCQICLFCGCLIVFVCLMCGAWLYQLPCSLIYF